MDRRRSLIVLGVVLGVAALVRLLVNECASGGAMGSPYRACECKGVEWVVSDQVAVDGPRRTICLGGVTERTCHSLREGPQVPCSTLPR